MNSDNARAKCHNTNKQMLFLTHIISKLNVNVNESDDVILYDSWDKYYCDVCCAPQGHDVARLKLTLIGQSET